MADEPSEAPADVERAFDREYPDFAALFGAANFEHARNVFCNGYRIGFAASAASHVDDNSPGDVIEARADGTIVLDDGITTHSYERACEWFASSVAASAAERERLRGAIERALADSESGTGWGPDVTVCAYLRAALEPER